MAQKGRTREKMGWCWRAGSGGIGETRHDTHDTYNIVRPNVGNIKIWICNFLTYLYLDVILSL